MPLSLFILQGLVAALLFYVLVGQHHRQPLWNMLAMLVVGMLPPVNWAILLVAVGLRLWRKPVNMVTVKN
ncbi:hypothetical protein C9927_01340 [Pseudidiomarina aestuarii]|uniref:Uncharacterized protein n=1 Tax=Pseudidiomarina aestuarii TaxID=624146 RepID=A0A2T4D8A1_9GAMM|nr:hypothetical protein C9986_02010 [Pseudidiomarina aestuarii]PTB89757.1 hypothetical protein C9927_01340 [Pseudidiomarina aestuarii]PTB90066.1 hypothetical protein C9928_01400 [Pseudidiomarina aestuarii]